MSAFIVRDGEARHRTLISDRDIGLLFGPLFTMGAAFSATFGFYENFSVAHGVPEGSYVDRPGRKLFNSAHGLLNTMERDIDLLQFDYLFSLAGGRTHRGPESILIRGRNGQIITSPPGYCYAQVSEPGPKGSRVVELVDLRVVSDFVVDGGLPVTVQRKPAKVNWLDVLPPLLLFLRPRVKKRLVVEHIDRAV